MIQVILAAVVATWFFAAAGRVDLRQGKWVFFGLVSYFVPSILWSAVFVFFLRKPLLESLFQYGSDSVTFTVGLVTIGTIGPALGFACAYVLNRKYLHQEVRELAVTLEQNFITKKAFLLAMLITSVLVLYLAAKYAPVVRLESKFDYTLF